MKLVLAFSGVHVFHDQPQLQQPKHEVCVGLVHGVLPRGVHVFHDQPQLQQLAMHLDIVVRVHEVPSWQLSRVT